MIVTGASSGIGRATALRFARQHAHVTLIARGESALQEAALDCQAEGAASVDVQVCDVTDAAALERVVQATLQRHGRVDVIVHAAAVMAYGTVEELSPEVYRQVVDTLIHGTANVARVVLPVFRRQEQGSLIVVSSLLASIAAPLMGAYVTAKWGQLGLIRVLQIETQDVPGISITAVAPGGVDTPIYYQAANVVGWEGRPPPPVYTPDRTAKAIVDQVGGRRRPGPIGLRQPAHHRRFPAGTRDLRPSRGTIAEDVRPGAQADGTNRRERF